jgi:hypothetical protein
VFLAVVAFAVCTPAEEQVFKGKRHSLAYPNSLAAAAPWGWNGGAYPYAGWNGAYWNPVSNAAYTINPYTGLPVRVDTPWSPAVAPFLPAAASVPAAPVVPATRPIVAV